MKKQKLLAMSLAIVMSASLFSGCVVTVGVPEVKEARFDFSVTYELEGEQKTYTGVYVCEYDGVLTTLVSSSIKWKGYIENEKEIDVPIQTNEDGTVYINLGFNPEYFMGDPAADYYEAPAPSLYMIYSNSTEDQLYITGDEEEILQYGVKIISYEYAEPIENSFKEKTTISSFVPSIN